MSQSVTIGQHLVRSYFELETFCNNKIGRSVLPNIETMEPADIAVLITQFFSSGYESQDYYEPLSQYAMMVGVSEKELSEVYPTVRRFITDTLTLLKEKKV